MISFRGTGEIVDGQELHVIPGYEGWYYATKDGRVYGKHYRGSRNRGRFMGLTRDRSGYMRVGLGQCKQNSVHRLVAMACIPNPKKLPFVNHKDSNRGNNRVENLEWCTPKENTFHSISVGRFKSRGESNKKSLLNETKVREIRQRYGAGDAVSRLAKEFGVSVPAIYAITSRRNWAYLTQ